MIIIYTYTIILSLTTSVLPLSEALLGPIYTNLYCFATAVIFAAFFRLCIPVKKINFNSRFFKVKDKEMKFFEKIKVKKWKHKIPELGKLGYFSKKNVLSLEEPYLKLFLQETCFGETLHLFSGILTFPILIFMPINSLIFTLPILLVNLSLHILPCIVQRYVRYKLVRIYNHKFNSK